MTERDPHPGFDSLFEQRVYLRIRNRGFRVRPQVTAYGYRIDLVVLGGEGRLAVECDGDQWHGPEEYEHDLARQQDLERVGWRFVRIRESEYYLDPEAALRPLWAKLQEVGIRPQGATGVGAPEAEVDSAETESVVRALLEPFRAEEIAETEDAETPAAGTTIGVASTASVVPSAKPAVAPAGSGLISPPTKDAEAEKRRPPTRSLASGRQNMSPYIAWEPRPLADPREARQPDLVSVLLEVVATEGPVLARRAYRLMLQAAGFHRLVHAVVSPLNKAALRAEREGRLVAVPSGLGNSLADRVLRLPSQPAVVVRQRGPRDLEEVPASEIKEVARLLRDGAPVLVDLGLKRDLLAAYGRTALTQAASSYIERCLGAATPLGPTTHAEQQVAWGSTVSRAPAPTAMPLVRRIPTTAPVVDFPKVLAGLIAKAQTLSSGARVRLAAEWLDDEREAPRHKVVQAAALMGAPGDWSVVARVVTARLAEWPAAGRGAVVDAAYAQTATGVPEDAEVLLRPWQRALVHVGHDVETAPARPIARRGAEDYDLRDSGPG